MTEGELGERLTAAGLHPRMLALWAGTDRLSALPALAPRLAQREVIRASAVLALFVAGADVARDLLGALVDPLIECDLVELRDTQVRAKIAILPIGSSLLVCDRLDAAAHADLVCCPDDSSYHLARSLRAAPHERWLDLGCGSAFAPLRHPQLGAAIFATDINRRATRFARLGLALSRIDHAEVACGDLASAVPDAWRGGCDLVSCNAPIPEPFGDPYRPRWRTTGTDFIARLYSDLALLVAPHGVVVVHAALDALAPVVATLPGERTLVAYTPPEVRGFAIAWWAPGGVTRHIAARRLLTDEQPHLTHEDRRAALASTLPAL